MTGSLTQIAAGHQRRFDAATSARARREQGHFGTSPAIAEFMAGMFPAIPQGTVRVLDPGAGVGTLSAALCDRILRQQAPRRLVLELWENDPKLTDLLRETMTGCQSALAAAGHSMEFAIRTEDFVLEHAQPALFRDAGGPRFDWAVMNPPYFKLRKDSEYARLMEHVVHGQPNIYALFMAVAADLLVTGGQLVAITPRSYFNGPYFKRFRKWFLGQMTARHIHTFESRDAAFREDAVLQENVILLAAKHAAPAEVVVTSSSGRDFQQHTRRILPYSKVVEETSGDQVIRVASGELDQVIVSAMDRLPRRFRDLPFKISTGPVVMFRAAEFLRDRRSADTAPLLSMHNVRPFLTQFPRRCRKPSHLIVNEGSEKLLLPAGRYVLLKRFTAKEEHRRLVAGILEASDSYAPVVGLENHLNYVSSIDGELSRPDAFGLAAWFNSAAVDRYFRTISGSTQVNAAEIRAMPIPDRKSIRRIGMLVDASSDREREVERIVGRAIGLSPSLIAQLDGTAQ